MKGLVGFLFLAALSFVACAAEPYVPADGAHFANVLVMWCVLGMAYLVAIAAIDVVRRVAGALRARYEAKRALRRSLGAWRRIEDREQQTRRQREGWGIH